MELTDLKKFLAERPAISVNRIEKDSGLAQGYINKMLSGKFGLTQKTADKILPVLKKYGY